MCNWGPEPCSQTLRPAARPSQTSPPAFENRPVPGTCLPGACSKKMAMAQRQAFEDRERAAIEGEEAATEGSGSGAGSAALPDLSLKPGEVMRLKIAVAGGAGQGAACGGGGGFVSSRRVGGGGGFGPLGKTFSLIMDGQAALAPPPRRKSGDLPDLPMNVSPSHSSASEASSDEEGPSGQIRKLRLDGEVDGPTPLPQQQGPTEVGECEQQQGEGLAAGHPPVAGASAPPAEGSDEFGDFVG